MKWLAQLKLILWKNFLLRRRQKIRCLAEFLWPLFLFLILMWVRTRGLRRNVEECHLMEKAMPSAGSFPFLQSFLCTFNNTCEANLTDTQVHPVNFTTSRIKKLFAELKQIFEDDSEGSELDEAASDIRNALGVMKQISNLVKTMNEEETLSSGVKVEDVTKGHEKTRNSLDANSLEDSFSINFLQNTPGKEHLSFPVSNATHNLTNLYKQLKNEIGGINKYATILRNLTLTQRDTDLFEDDKKFIKYRKALSVVYKYLCGNKTEDILTQMAYGGGKPHAFDSLQDQFKDKIKIIYKYDNTTTEECNAVMSFFQRIPPLKAFWDVMKPFVMGKIVFTPVTPALERLMQKVNDTFNPLRELKKFVDNLPIEKLPLTSPEELEKARQDFLVFKNFTETRLGKLLSSNYISDDERETIKNLTQQFSLFQDRANSLYPDTRKLNITSIFSCLDTEKVVGINDINMAHIYSTDLLYQNKLWALLEFKDSGIEKLEPLISYSIRMNVDKVDDTNHIKDRLQTNNARIRPQFDLKYLTYGFAYIQDILDKSIISEQSGRTDLPGIVFQQFPFPCYIIDQFIIAISRTFPLFMVLSWVYTCSMIVKSVVYEKEERLKETMRVMGLPNGIHWLGWLIDSLIPMILTNVALTLVLVYGKILTYSDPTLLFVFLTCYSLATISQSFLISVFFSKANLAAACAGTIFFVLYLPYPFLERWLYYLLPYHKALLSLSSNVALGVGASYFASYEERGIGANWQNVGISPLYNDDFSLSYVICLLMFDFLLYMIFTIYIEAVFPGHYGIPKPWYFPFTLSYWTGRQPRKVFVKPKSIATGSSPSQDLFEQEPTGLELGVSIVKLSKIYRNGKKAVDNVSLNFYQDQITSFLGHNGAGKTTTISILTGIFPPSEGTAYINGLDITTEMDKIRNNLGMCPQYNVLFNRLTVEEHLWFYGKLRAGKDLTDEAVKVEIEQMLMDLDLIRKRNSLPSDLSGGMQRKLSISVAFIGGSKTVILDEPTSGVDPYSRRSIWELLIKYKKGRTIILTTHFMDEADLLGDRIAIIANGQLQCCGSGVFLKAKLGDGYRLTVEMSSISTVDLIPSLTDMKSIDNFYGDSKAKALVEHVKNIVPNAQFIEQIGTEVTIILPRSNNIRTFIVLFNSLDGNMEPLHIASYGISDTSLEEIFLRVAEQGDPAIKDISRGSKAGMSMFSRLYYLLLNKSPKTFNALDNTLDKQNKDVTVPVDELKNNPKKGSNKYWRQYWALHLKRFHHTKRNQKALFAELILPALFVCMALIVCSIFPSHHERPPLQVTPFIYSKPRYMFFDSEINQNPWMEQYINEMKGPLGLGTYCMTINGTKKSDCIIPSENPVYPSKPIMWPQCSCSTGAEICPKNIGIPYPPSFKLASDDTMYDMNSQNVSNWIINTWPKYNGERYGGYTFGSHIPVPLVNITSTIMDIISSIENKSPLTALKTLNNIQRAETSNNNVKVWFNNKGWVSSVGYLNAINNVILRASVSDRNSSSYGIITVNHPMNFTKNQLHVEMIKQGGLSLLMAISIIFSLSFVPASFTLYLIEERQTNSKHLQLVSGVNRLIYWTQTFTWDFLCYLVSATLCVFIFLIFNEEAYVSQNNFPSLVLLFILYGWSCIPLMYPVSFLFSVPSSAFVSLSCANVFIGIITTVTTFVLAAFDDPELRAVDDVIKEVFLIFPHFCLGDGLIKLATSHLFASTVSAFDIEYNQKMLTWNNVGKNLFCMFLSGIAFSLLALAVEYELFASSIRKKKKTNLSEFLPPFEEEDVKAEKIRIEEGRTTDDTLILKNLSKMYRKAKKPSVNNVSVGVKQGECFGLLGLNGAGKTTTFKMLTGAISPTAGDAIVKGHSIVNEIDKVRAVLGYCPQFDALDPLLTVREHLLLYGRIKNISSSILHQEVDEMLKRLSLGHYSDKLAGTLSGGNKRKLSTAIALLGNPLVIFMDEPTSGMDPKARRFLWTCIQDLIKQGCCVVLTSHSMEECQALCTKLTIMVNGQFKCLGTSQHLKNKYGGGYSVVIRCNDVKMAEVKSYIISEIESSKLIESHYNQLRYQIGTKKVAKIFEVLENAKSSDLIIDYSLSQTTLEDVFMRFANEQSEVVKEEKKILRRALVKKCLICYSGH